MNNRANDPQTNNYTAIRQQHLLPAERHFLEPGYYMLPADSCTVVTVVASSVVVTLYDIKRKIGGVCHYIKPRPEGSETASGNHGLPTIAYLTRQLLKHARPQDLRAGIYGGASPTWATPMHRRMAQANVDAARAYLAKMDIVVDEEMVGGTRGFKLVYNTGTNEILLLKTERIRRADWFTHLQGGK